MKKRLHLQFFAESAETICMTEATETATETATQTVVTSEETTVESEQPAAEKKTESANDSSEKTNETEQEAVLSEEMIHKIYGHFAKLEEETRELKETFPDFDLYRELKNPAFARLTAPENGIHAADAYYAIHRKEIQSMYAERNSTEKKSSPKKDSPKRPSENGISAQAPALMEFDYRNASKERREALKKAIRTAAAKGEKIYPR